jgi:nickel-dependent lactate racemase
MAEVVLPYGDGTLTARLPSSSWMGSVVPAEEGEPPDQDLVLRQALDHPIGTRPLRELVRPGQKVAVVTSDLTRPCPSAQLLPPVLAELSQAGVRDGDVFVVTALGLHRPMTTSELAVAVGDPVRRRVRVLNHDPDDVVRLGVTAAGTPVEIHRPVVEADVRVCLGNLEFHYFAGFSGGAKAILPGCASRAAVNGNHAMMAQPGAEAGRLEGNPVRADLEEGVAMLGVDFLLNVLVDGQHRIIEAVAGHLIEAHRRGCARVAGRGAVPIPRRVDLVLVSAGGYPKDLNMYQAQKALDNAAGAVRDGGIIVWVAECREGLGEATFESWLRRAASPDAVLERIRRGFALGGHKAAAIAAVLRRARVFLVSALDPALVRECMLEPFADLDEAVEAALSELGPSARALALPLGGSVLPRPRE